MKIKEICEITGKSRVEIESILNKEEYLEIILTEK